MSYEITYKQKYKLTMVQILRLSAVRIFTFLNYFDINNKIFNYFNSSNLMSAKKESLFNTCTDIPINEKDFKQDFHETDVKNA